MLTLVERKIKIIKGEIIRDSQACDDLTKYLNFLNISSHSLAFTAVNGRLNL